MHRVYGNALCRFFSIFYYLLSPSNLFSLPIVPFFFYLKHPKHILFLTLYTYILLHFYLISRGYYTIPEDTISKPNGWAKERRGQQICPLGSYCAQGVKTLCPSGRWGGTTGLYQPKCSGICRQGYYCPAGSVNAYQIPCPQGTYGNKPGLGNIQDCLACPNGATCDLDGVGVPVREPRNR